MSPPGRLSARWENKTAAMERFRIALRTSKQQSRGVRLAIAQLMAQQGRAEDAERQIALALMEAEAGETPPPDGNQFIAAADVFRRRMITSFLKLTFNAQEWPVHRKQRCGLGWPTTISHWETRPGLMPSYPRSAGCRQLPQITSICWPRPTSFARNIRMPRRSLPSPRLPTPQAKIKQPRRACSRRERTKD